MARPSGTRRLISNTSGIGSPTAARSYAYRVEGGDVVRQEDPPLPRGPGQHRAIVGTRETGVPQAHQIEIRPPTQEPPHEVRVQVLVRRQPQHRARSGAPPGQQSIP